MTVNGHTKHFGFATRAVHVSENVIKSESGAVIAPISLSTTFKQSSVSQPVGSYEYSRSGNPNREAFETAVASLEQAKYGIGFSSGSAATATILQSLAMGSHVVAISDVYGGTYRYLTKVASTHGVEVTFTSKIGAELEKLLRPETRLVWIESPSNPTLSMVDIQAVSGIANSHGITTVVDNTFASSYICNPLVLGADIVVHSVTKYLNGHSDVVMGVACTNQDGLHDKLRFLQNSIGAIPSAFDCWLAIRGLKTLALRVKASSTNATAIAHALQSSPHVVLVNYPGLKSHPQHDVVMQQHREGMGGGMVSFRMIGGAEAANRFCQKLQIFTLAESLGGVESLVEVPAAMTHSSIPREQRMQAGVYDDLIRLSCGIEEAEDLVSDVLTALED